MHHTLYHRLTGAVFALIALAHVVRFALDVPVQVGTFQVPQSLSLVGAVVALVLAIWSFRGSKDVAGLAA